MKSKKRYVVTMYPVVQVTKENVEAESAEAALRAFYDWWRTLGDKFTRLLPESSISVGQEGGDVSLWVDVNAEPMSLADMVELVGSTRSQPDVTFYDKSRLH